VLSTIWKSFGHENFDEGVQVTSEILAIAAPLRALFLIIEGVFLKVLAEFLNIDSGLVLLTEILRAYFVGVEQQNGLIGCMTQVSMLGTSPASKLQTKVLSCCDS
jgi:hypothetical protein